MFLLVVLLASLLPLSRSAAFPSGSDSADQETVLSITAGTGVDRSTLKSSDVVWNLKVNEGPVIIDPLDTTTKANSGSHTTTHNERNNLENLDIDVSSGETGDLDSEWTASEELLVTDFLDDTSPSQMDKVVTNVISGGTHINKLENSDVKTSLEKFPINNSASSQLDILQDSVSDSTNTEAKAILNESNISQPVKLNQEKDPAESTSEAVVGVLPDFENFISQEFATSASEVLNNTMDVIKEIISFFDDPSSSINETQEPARIPIDGSEEKFENPENVDIRESSSNVPPSSVISVMFKQEPTVAVVDSEVQGGKTDMKSSSDMPDQQTGNTDFVSHTGELEASTFLPPSLSSTIFTLLDEVTRIAEQTVNSNLNFIESDGHLPMMHSAAPEKTSESPTSSIEVTDKDATSMSIDKLELTSTETSTNSTTNSICPAPGICLLWFLAQDTCAVDSHCLGSRICCKIRCSKTCIDVQT